MIDVEDQGPPTSSILSNQVEGPASLKAISERKWFDVKEGTRTYVYPTGERLVFNDVVRVGFSESKTTYIEYHGGALKAIVPFGWRAILLSGTTEWTA